MESKFGIALLLVLFVMLLTISQCNISDTHVIVRENKEQLQRIELKQEFMIREGSKYLQDTFQRK